MLDGIAYASVLGDALVGEVNLAVLVNRHVLEKSVALDGTVDVRLVLLGEVDDLGIAAAFEVEHAFIVPTMLVVANEQTLRVGRKSSLACAGEAEEDSGVLALHIRIGGAVHAGDALQGQVVVLHGEHTLLHFAAVPCVDDDLLASLGVEGNTSVGVESEFLVVLNLSLAGIEDDKVRLELGEFLLCGLDEHVLDEVCLPSHLDDEADSQTCCLIGTAECVNHIQLLAAEFLDSDVLHLCPHLFAHGMVVVLVSLGRPPYVVVALVVVNDVLVLGGATSEDACHYVHCTKLCLLSNLVTCERGIDLSLVEFLVRGVVSNHGTAGDAVLCQI